MSRSRIPVGALVKRAAKRACPVCGRPGIFESWFRLKDRCPSCGYDFSREPGYWVTAIIVNMAVIEGLFLSLFIGVVVFTAPDVNWPLILVAGVIMNVVFPIFFYPYSKTLWMALDLSVHPLNDEDAARRISRSPL